MVSRISYDQTMQELLGLRLIFCLSNGSLIRLVALGGEDCLVGVIKSPLKKILGKALLSVKELSTVIKEVEGIVNDRSITYVGCFDDERPLTPSMLIGNIWNKETVHVTSESRKELTTQTVEQATRRWRYVEKVQHLCPCSA